MYKVFCEPGSDFSHLREADGKVKVVEVGAPGEADPKGEASVMLIGGNFREPGNAPALEKFQKNGGGLILLGLEGETDAPLLDHITLDGYVPHPYPKNALQLTVRSALGVSHLKILAGETERLHQASSAQIKEFVRVGTALATERDYEAFYQTALTQAMKMAHADGGSLYLIEEVPEGGKRLRFKLAMNKSRPDIPFKEFTLPLSKGSIAGYVAITGETVVLDDAYNMPPGAGYVINKSFDQEHGYHTKSMVAIPMVTHKEEIVGVVQLVNRKTCYDDLLTCPLEFKDNVEPFDAATVELLGALSAQIAVCLENNRLYEEIERLFEGFVTASVLAIEQRDPTTSGHSGRVATLTVGLAEAADRIPDGPFADLKFTREELRELRYAGMLHDFGKVGVREEVLVKPTKLQPWELEMVKKRHAFLKRTAERDFFRRRVEWLEKMGREEYNRFLEELTVTFETEQKELDAFMDLVLQSNLPTVLPEGNFDALHKFGKSFFTDADGEDKPYLTDDEVRYLSIRKGSLDDTERMEIESHVTKTYLFLQKIPWTKNLKNLPEIAYGHHEKLNGHGYPRGLGERAIPVQTRMMTIADIYDALTASDRPYKRAVPVEKALDILHMEAKDGMLDRELLDLFVGAGIFSLTAPK